MKQVQNLPLTQVFPNPSQPRKKFDAEYIDELARNIKAVGLLQPITVVERQGMYMIVSGECRYHAHMRGQIESVPAIVEQLSDAEVQLLALIENIKRRDMTLMEEARAYQDQIDRGMTVKELAEKLGFKQPHRITERTDLLKMDPKFQDTLERGIISPSQAWFMCRLSVEGQYQLWRSIQNGQCSTYEKLKKMAGAIEDAENQTSMFSSEPVSEAQRNSISKVDRFIQQADALLGSVTEDDLSVIESVLKSDAPACVQKLNLLMGVAKKVREALETNIAKQSVGFAA